MSKNWSIKLLYLYIVSLQNSILTDEWDYFNRKPNPISKINLRKFHLFQSSNYIFSISPLINLKNLWQDKTERCDRFPFHDFENLGNFVSTNHNIYLDLRGNYVISVQWFLQQYMYCIIYVYSRAPAVYYLWGDLVIALQNNICLQWITSSQKQVKCQISSTPFKPYQWSVSNFALQYQCLFNSWCHENVFFLIIKKQATTTTLTCVEVLKLSCCHLLWFFVLPPSSSFH